MNFLFSIITPIYKTPDFKLQRLYNSLVEQTYSNWEWIVLDDSPIEHLDSYNFISNLSKTDSRIKLYSNDKNYGIIGEVKRKAFYLATGDILVEVDHDDELIDTCLENLSIAYSYSDDIGFVYGHACEIYEDSENYEDIIDYGDNWAFGYGRYEITKYKDKYYKVAIVGNINPKTIRHISGIPNHVRSWRKEVYHKIGGHNKILDVADDYELFIRTFLKTKIAKIDAFTYIQYFERNNTQNTQFKKNPDIQRFVHQTSKFYNNKINKRFIELGIDDYVFVDNITFNTEIENPEIESFANIVIPIDKLKNVLTLNIEQKIFFDIGANEGNSSVHLAKNQNHNIFYAFEPVPEMCEIIKEKIKNIKNYKLIQKAVSNFNGISKFNVCSIEEKEAIKKAREYLNLKPENIENDKIVGWGNSSLLDFSEKSDINSPLFDWCTEGLLPRADFIVNKVIDVEVINLYDFVIENNIEHIDFIQIDAQGSDLKVLEGLSDKINIIKSGAMIAATKKDILYVDQNTLEDSINFLTNNNFTITKVENYVSNGNLVKIYFKNLLKNKIPNFKKIEINNEINTKIINDKKDLYGYSRVYSIPCTLEYKQTEHYSNLLKWLIRLTNCQTYLELGVEYGLNIKEVKNLVKTCVGVDIDVCEIIDKGNIIFYQMSTDDFFKKNTQTFDIIFIDANHKYEQVKKDFDNSLKILNKYGIIILHDTDPIIEELIDSKYCNDSYKIVDYISNIKELNIITLPIQETGLTLVMRKNERRINNFIKNK